MRVRSYSGTGTSELSTPVSGGGGEWRIGSQEHGAPRDLRFPPDSRCFFLSFWVSFLGRRGSCFHGEGFRSSSLVFFLYDVCVRERSECGSGAFPGSKWGIRVWFLGFCRGGGVVGFKQRRRNLVGCCFRKRVMSNPVD